jgi:hypothetical protein
MSSYWRVPPLFTGRRVVVIATGPSLTADQVKQVRASGDPVIAVNNGYEYAPWADLLYACDLKWWVNYREKGKLGGAGNKSFAGLKVSLEETPYPEVLRIGNGGTFGFDERHDHVRTGKNSACQAVHVAAHAGAETIILLGCDCTAPSDGPSHCFGDHDWRRGKMPSPYNEFLEGWSALAPALSARGIRVINASPGSAIECFEKAGLEEALKS